MGPSNTFRMSRQMALRLLVVIFAANVHAAPSKCVLPTVWRGNWFHSGVQLPVVLNETSISFKGNCVQSDRDRYLIEDMDHRCYRCLVIHEKHVNVLQYKETFCDQNPSLEYVCMLLTGDAQLHSMFRLGSAPVPCPFPHRYTFTYNRGHAECSYPRSSVDSCTEDWRMLFRYQACPDIQGTESTTEEFVCLATWKEGSNRYLVGKADHPLATSDEDRYRCFVYDAWTNHSHNGFQMAQSGDATCNGLFSISAGSRRLHLIKLETNGNKCRFPSWVGGPHWHSLDGRKTLHVTRKNSTLRLTGHTGHGPETYACMEPFSHTKRSAAYVTRVTYGCRSEYQCVHMLARDDHVLEVLMGQPVPVADACNPSYFDIKSTNYTTFVSGNAETRQCPGMGRYLVTQSSHVRHDSNEGGNVAASTSGGDSTAIMGTRSGGHGGNTNGVGSLIDGGGLLAINHYDRSCESAPYVYLFVGCSDTSTLEIQSTCTSSGIHNSSEYSCHGFWEEAGRQYLVVTPISRSSKGVRRLCLVLDHGMGVLSLTSSTHSCSRDLTPGFPGHIALNTTSMGGCDQLDEPSSSPTLQRVSMSLLVGLLLGCLLGVLNARGSAITLWTY